MEMHGDGVSWHVHVCNHTQTYIRAHIHTYVHTYIHTEIVCFFNSKIMFFSLDYFSLWLKARSTLAQGLACHVGICWLNPNNASLPRRRLSF